MVAFLRELAASQSVSQAARSVGMSRQSAYKLRTRLEGTPFALAWEGLLDRIEADGNRWDHAELAAEEALLTDEEREELADPLKRLAAESWYVQNLPRQARG